MTSDLALASLDREELAELRLTVRAAATESRHARNWAPAFQLTTTMSRPTALKPDPPPL